MADHNDKMLAFGTWLGSRIQVLQAELMALSVNAQAPAARIRVKAGQLEGYAHIYGAFKELYNGDLKSFNESYLGIQPEKEDEKESDGHGMD